MTTVLGIAGRYKPKNRNREIRNMRKPELKAYDEEVEIEQDELYARFQLVAHDADASFDHHFGTETVIDFEVDELILLEFERWDEDGEVILSKTPTPEELEMLEVKAIDEVMNG
jgi:hypothetical protein